MAPISFSTQQWVDLYSLTLDRLAEQLVDPEKTFSRLGINKNEEGAVNVPQAMALSKYKELMTSWKKVRAVMLEFGLELGEDLELAPITINTEQWMKNPWLEVTRPGDPGVLKFFGRDALTAFGFINFFIQHCETLDPNKRVKEGLLAQGINKDNFFKEVGLAGISDPWANERVPVPKLVEKDDAPYSLLSSDESIDTTPLQFPVPDALPTPEPPPPEPPKDTP